MKVTQVLNNKIYTYITKLGLNISESDKTMPFHQDNPHFSAS